MRGGNVLGCVAGMCWDAWRECAAKCVPEKRETAGMRGGNVLGCMAGMCCKMCYTEPVEVRARKAGNCWDAWRECAAKCVPEKRETAGMRG